MTFNTVSGLAPLSYLGTPAVNPPSQIIAIRAPTVTDGNSGTPIGTEWIDTVGLASYKLVGTTGSSFQGTFLATWAQMGAGAGFVANVVGTANQITVITAAGTATVSLPAVIIAPGSLTTTTTLAAGTTITAGTGITSTLGNIVASAGNINATLGSMSAGTTVTAGTGITATTGNIVASTGNITSTLGSMSAATTMTAGTGITATTGNIVASTGNITSTLGAVAAATTVTAGTGITSTLGNLNLAGLAGKTVGTTGALVAGSLLVANTSVTAASKFFFTANTLGTVTAPQSYYVSARVPGASFTVTSFDGTDTSTVDFFFIN
jgi:hypothetical protein